MATPYVAGAATILLQKLQKTQPTLSGAAKVSAVKNALMNGASPMKDINDRKVWVSPRRQGAGQINVSRAADFQASATDPTTHIAAVSLGQMGSTRHFKVELTNNGTVPLTYTLDDNGGLMTEVRDKKKSGQVHDRFLAGAAVTADSSNITVSPGDSQVANLTLTVPESVKRQQVVEGYLTFKANLADQSLTIPYFGYYGDATQERVIDAPAYNPQNVFNGGYLLDEDNTPLGISDRASVNRYINAHADKMSWPKIVKYIHPGLVAFSPNDDHQQDSIKPLVYAKQSLAGVKAQIVDRNGRVIRVIDQETNLDKSIADESGNLDLTSSYTMRQHPNAFQWDGRYDDAVTGRNKVVPDGHYHYQLVTTNYNDGAQKQQVTAYPLIVDTVAPKAADLVYTAKSGQLRGRFSDRGAGFTKISRAALEINRKQYAISLTTKATTAGHFTDHLAKPIQAALQRHRARLRLTDIAGNSATFSIHRRLTKSKRLPSQRSQIRLPQFGWYRYGSRKAGFSNTYLELRDRSFTLLARIPKNVPGLRVYAKNTLTNRVTKAHIDSAKGIAAFHLKFGSSGILVLSGWSQIPGDRVGQYFQSRKADISVSRFPKADLLQKMKKLAPKLLSKQQAKKAVVVSTGAPQIYGHRQKDLTYRASATPGIKFNQLKDNGPTWLNAKTSAAIYNPKTQKLTITGQVKDPKTQKLTILVTPNDQAAINQIALSPNGRFSVEVPFNPTEQRGIGYVLTTKVKTKNKVKFQRDRGVLEVYLDTVAPTLTVQKTVADGKVTFTGSANDNVSGVRLLINGSNLLTQQNDGGMNQHLPDQPLNPYPAVQFMKTYSLKPGANYFKVEAMDQVGNVTTGLFTINN